MEFEIYSHRHGQAIVEGNEEANEVFDELCKFIKSISEEEILEDFIKRRNLGNKDTSLSKVLNAKFKDNLPRLGWSNEVHIFKEEEYKSSSDWRLDFAYEKLFSMEVAFNHSSAAIVNLMKPVLASEINHVRKELDGEKRTNFGIIITATEELKKAGGFDGAIGAYEQYKKQFKPYMNFLITPTILIGIKAPKSYRFEKTKKKGDKTGSFSIYSTTNKRKLFTTELDNK